ncbi:3-oxoacyl-ACP reductase [Cystobacter fuscus]|uniref:3-oxoacyl-ACP reductase n=1 Tax=Cystobacter fuscus TaxID=43 RepID=A0A250IYS2_9BACT|nr:SDR family oxidoreductase [Cystobacter fuscus]ATB36884.1 3-oxoacyl-ACP reductase [Cystobacter fuscus]
MRIAVITGGSRGIGRSAALQIARRGVGVVVTFNSHPTGAESVVRDIEAEGGRATALKLDVRDVGSFAAFRDALSAVARGWGRDTFDILVHNAGYGLYNPIETVTEAEFDGLFGVHLKGPFFLTQTLLPLIAAGGHIINVTSVTTRVATAGVAPYAAFKSGLETLTRYMAKEFGSRGIRANAVSPGPIRTDLAGGLSPDFEALLASQTALGRIGEPDDVGRVIASLLSEDQRWVNAQCIELSGGYII